MGNSSNKLRKCGKKTIEAEIKHVLEKHGEISFAYLHGSFVKEACIFRDIDVAVYIEKRPESVLEYELGLETKLMKAVGGYIVNLDIAGQLNGQQINGQNISRKARPGLNPVIICLF